jgi:Tol biopolymer transport system component
LQPCGWSSDGKAVLALDAQIGKDLEHWLVAADGSGEKRLPIRPTDVVLDWSPDGKRLATREKLADHAIHLMNTDGSGKRLLLESAEHVPGSGSRLWAPQARFSPDGHKLLFVDEVPDDTVRPRTAKSRGLLLLDIDGGPPRRFFVMEGKSYPHNVCWSPDGQTIAVVIVEGPPAAAAQSVNAHIELIDSEGRTLQKIALPASPLAHVIDWR